MDQPGSKLKVAVIGVGRMGQHHARTYAAMPEADLVGLVDVDADRAAELSQTHGGRAYTCTDALLEAEPDLAAVSVAVPTHAHVQVARPLLQRGVACLVEKPLASTTQAARELAEIARQTGSVLQVGHTERFNPAVRAVAAMGIPPRFMEVDRISPLTFRSLDVSVVMDMMIHDLDIVLMLAGSPIRHVDAAGVAVIGREPDVASTRIVFESGCVANLTASRLALKTERKLRIFSEDAYVSLNYQKRDGVVIRKAANAESLDEVRHRLAAGDDLSELDYTSLVNVDELKMDLPEGEDDPLRAELASFLRAAATGEQPIVSAEAGQAAVDAAERVAQAIAAHEWKGLEEGKFKIQN